MCLCFFCRQKTAYELRISDCSSDGCSADLAERVAERRRLAATLQPGAVGRLAVVVPVAHPVPRAPLALALLDIGHGRIMRRFRPPSHASIRSEEHTSELQSLMRISYAVFCLNKKKQTTTRSTHNQNDMNCHKLHHSTQINIHHD